MELQLTNEGIKLDVIFKRRLCFNISFITNDVSSHRSSLFRINYRCADFSRSRMNFDQEQFTK